MHPAIIIMDQRYNKSYTHTQTNRQTEMRNITSSAHGMRKCISNEQSLKVENINWIAQHDDDGG